MYHDVNKSILASVLLLSLGTGAFATGKPEQQPTTINAPSAGAAANAGAVGVGVGIAGAASQAGASSNLVGSGNSAVRSDVRNSVNVPVSVGAEVAGSTSNNTVNPTINPTITGAAGNTGTSDSKSQANGNAVNIGGDTYERSAPGVALAAQQQPITGCRYVLGLAGSNTSGSMAAGIPLWKDSECKGGAAIRAMNQAPSGTFNSQDYRIVICENMDAAANTPTCKNLKQDQRAEAILNRDYTAQYSN